MNRHTKRTVLAAWLLLMTGLTGWEAAKAMSLVGRPYPGFFVQPLIYVSPYQLPATPAAGRVLEPLDQILSVEGRPVRAPGELLDAARRVPAGTPLRYVVRREGREATLALPTHAFGWGDFFQSFGALALLGWGLSAIGLVLFWLRPDAPAARALAAAMGALGVAAIVYLDFNLTAEWGRLFLLADAMIGASFLALAGAFPRPSTRLARLPFAGWAPWALGFAVAATFQLLYLAEGPATADPLRYQAMYAALIAGNMWLMLGFGAVIGRIAWRFAFEARGTLPRHQAGAALAGVAIAFTPFIAWAAAFSAGLRPILPLSAALCCFLAFPLAIAYAIARTRLFDITVVVRNSVLYTLLSALLAAVYTLVATTFRLVGLGSIGHEDLPAELLATGLVVALFAPVRDRLQAFLDRKLFREAYDAQQALEEASESMTSLLDLDAIVEKMLGTVEATLHVEAGAVLLASEDGSAYVPYGSCGEVRYPTLAADTPLIAELKETQALLTRVELPVRKRLRVSGNLEALTAELVVPLAFQGRLRGLLVLGAKRSDTPFTDQDLRLLMTLANQSAIALENARAYRRIQAFNSELEAKVKERTAELEAAYRSLKRAQTKLLHTEKMAALGQLVAGVAHELNNPLTFVYSGVGILRQSFEDLARLHDAYAAGAPPEVIARLRAEIDDERLIAELPVLLESYREGASRMKAIVQNLRDFSRLEEFALVELDLRRCVEDTVPLAMAQHRDRVRLHLDLPAVPPIAGSETHLKQVITNLIVNACQAVEAGGQVWISLSDTPEAVALEVRDDGCGMDEEVRRRIFEPFFTTKGVGEGTGLGLSICHGIIEQHGGRIEVDSAPGRGTRIRLSFRPLLARA